MSLSAEWFNERRLSVLVVLSIRAAIWVETPNLGCKISVTRTWRIMDIDYRWAANLLVVDAISFPYITDWRQII